MKKWIIAALVLLVLGVVGYVKRYDIYNYGRGLVLDKKSTTLAPASGSDVLWGIDISHHQPRVDWDALAEHNKPDFIFLKCSEGRTHKDTKYATYKQEANKRGIVTGAYHFFSYQSPGKDQALHFIQHANLKNGDLIPVLDIEYKKNRPGNAAIRKEVRAFCAVIREEYGVNPIIYCEYSYYNNILKSEFADYHYWICDFSGEPTKDYVFWQYTDRGEVKGIGKVDNNRMKKGLSIEAFLLGNS